MKSLWMRAGIASLALTAMLGTLAATTAPASADAWGRWKVVSGHLNQSVNWITSSSADNGCYTHIFGDTGADTISYKAVVGASVELQEPRPGNWGLTATGSGVPFSGSDKQKSEYRLTSRPDENAPTDCQPDTQKPPDTSGCTTARVPHQRFNLYEDPARGVFLDGIVSKPRWFGYACPSDDAYSVITVNANSGVDPKEFEHHRQVHLAGSETDPTKEWLSYPAYQNQHGSQSATINWALTLKRAHR
jgi:hypothetical protein